MSSPNPPQTIQKTKHALLQSPNECPRRSGIRAREQTSIILLLHLDHRSFKFHKLWLHRFAQPILQLANHCAQSTPVFPPAHIITTIQAIGLANAKTTRAAKADICYYYPIPSFSLVVLLFLLDLGISQLTDSSFPLKQNISDFRQSITKGTGTGVFQLRVFTGHRGDSFVTKKVGCCT